MTQALYRKWRPQKWEDVSDQQQVTQTLRNAVTAGRMGHAYLFSGPRGTGKTSVARLLAKAVNCLADSPAERPCNQCDHCLAVNKGSFLDMIEIDAASNNGVDDVRDLRDKINFSPNQGRYKVYIIDEVHMLSTQAFNALLKTLEEPPPHAIFVLATTEIHKIPATVLSRCQRHEFKRASIEAITHQLKEIARYEKILADDEALILIARQATGSFRDAISLLDQIASTGEKITLKNTHAILGTAASQNMLELMDAIQKRQAADGLNLLHAALDAGTDPRVLARQIVEYLRALLLIKLGNPDQTNLPKESHKQAGRHAAAFSSQQLLHMIREFNAAAMDTRGGWQPALNLELALAGLMVSPEEKQPQILIQGSHKPQEEVRSSVQARKTLDVQPGNEPGSGQQGKGKPDVTPSKGKDDDFSRLTKEWKNISLAVRSNRSLNALLNSCRLVDLRKEVLTLGFASEILKDKANTPDQIETVQKTIKDLLGLDVQVKCVVTSARQETPADIKQDGMVAEAIKIGGKITDVHD